MSQNNLLKYKGYFGTAEYSTEDQCLWGKIQFINDVITYESDSAVKIQIEFELAVDDYIEFCVEVGKEPEKTMTGSFNIRIGAELHKQALVRSKSDGVTLNDLIRKSVSQYVCETPDIHHHVHTHESSEATVTTQPFEMSVLPAWTSSKEVVNGSH